MTILDLIFPKTCLSCGREGGYICHTCLSKVGKPKPVCPVCYKPTINGITHIRCRTKLGIDGLISIWKYEGVIRKAILALKYKRAHEIEKGLVKCMVNELARSMFPKHAHILPIPIYWHRENVRGFNQSSEIGRLLAERLDLEFNPNLLIKKRETKPQAELTGEERRKNLKGVFVVNQKIKLPNSVLLFDDVFTTGSTLKEACKAIKQAGAKHVWGLTIAK